MQADTLLDGSAAWERLDPFSMSGLIEAFPRQFADAVRQHAEPGLEPAESARQIVVAGLGGSAIGGDIVRCALGESLRVPMFACRDYSLPAFVDDRSVVVACSYSGNTEETLSCYGQAVARRSRVVCIASGGRLAAAAARDGIQCLGIPPGMPPRAAIAYSSIALLRALQAMKLASPQEEGLREASQELERFGRGLVREVPLSENPAKQLARQFHGKIVVIYSASGLLEAAAARWRSQIQENSKNFAAHHLLPEMNHNEILGWQEPRALLRQIAAVLLRDTEDHPQVRRRFDLTRDVLMQSAGSVEEVHSVGRSRFARLFRLIQLGDWVSLYLAYLNEIDPMRIDAIDLFKRRLEEK